ncbi:uncharacterized protein LOC121504641 isoform X3 [Cheilinus undulatus]|uniref:uncharacterized protein LOC121504641 isoform X3 n=1 Tax=Cheilinus undulatus TaxID=241271 RepID=UPI001BD35688|nr:uncharacterized protein LOC121504641 isoform X3 [Cheilinus undulatus]
MKSTLRTFFLPLLAVAAVLLLHEGSTQQDPQRCSVEVQIGGTAILHLNLNTTLDRNDVKVEWCHDKKHVHVFENNGSYLEYQLKAYKNRAFLFEGQISEGNVSLKLINVTEQDAGNYTCIIIRDKMPPKKFEFCLDVVDDSPTEASVGSPKPDPTPTPQPPQDTTVIIISVVAGVAVLGVIAGVLLCKRRGNTLMNSRLND